MDSFYMERLLSPVSGDNKPSRVIFNFSPHARIHIHTNATIDPFLKKHTWTYSCASQGYPIEKRNWRCQLGLAPAYLRDLCRPVSGAQGSRSLRSAERGVLV